MVVETHKGQVAELLSQPYRMVVRGDDAEGYLAEAPELPGCVTAGETPEEAFGMLREAMAAWFETATQRGIDIPPPAADQDYSGRILMRVPKALHRQLVEQAKDQGVSLNQWILTLLAARSSVASQVMAERDSAQEAARELTAPWGRKPLSQSSRLRHAPRRK